MITIHNYTEESIKIKTFSLKKKNFGRKKKSQNNKQRFKSSQHVNLKDIDESIPFCTKNAPVEKLV